jgi:hypothetical protein
LLAKLPKTKKTSQKPKSMGKEHFGASLREEKLKLKKKKEQNQAK